nr:unnamed protein product [Digitaria exilis]
MRWLLPPTAWRSSSAGIRTPLSSRNRDAMVFALDDDAVEEAWKRMALDVDALTAALHILREKGAWTVSRRKREHDQQVARSAERLRDERDRMAESVGRFREALATAQQGRTNAIVLAAEMAKEVQAAEAGIGALRTAVAKERNLKETAKAESADLAKELRRSKAENAKLRGGLKGVGWNEIKTGETANRSVPQSTRRAVAVAAEEIVSCEREARDSRREAQESPPTSPDSPRARALQPAGVMEGAVLACAAPGAAGGGGAGAGDVVRLKRSALAACLTCPLCGRLLRDAATITECLHTCECSPFANLPVTGVRIIDHSIQYVRSKVFPKKQKVEALEVASPITSPIKRKERSLSLLSIHAPQVSVQKCLTKRRTKASGLRNISLHSKMRSSNITKKVGGWRPLGSHFKGAKNKRHLRSKSEDAKTTENKSDAPVDGTPTSQRKAKRQFTRRGNLEKRTGSKKLLVLKGKQKKMKPKANKKRKLQALWFYLVAAFDQKGQPPLPQVESKFLRIKDVDLPASFIQKYLLQKLNLSSEAEVDILCGGKPVSPGMTLHDLADCWLDKGQKGRVRSSVGTPAAGFVAKVFYGRSGVPVPETEGNQGLSRT